jgi:Na+-transporting methylmalonyl-CoA/oxaloacetate decarboxylase beta subunit
MGGISLGGILVIIGIVVAILWSLWLGIVIALIGLIAFGGFLRGGGGTERHFGWP